MIFYEQNGRYLKPLNNHCNGMHTNYVIHIMGKFTNYHYSYTSIQ